MVFVVLQYGIINEDVTHAVWVCGCFTEQEKAVQTAETLVKERIARMTGPKQRRPLYKMFDVVDNEAADARFMFFNRQPQCKILHVFRIFDATFTEEEMRECEDTDDRVAVVQVELQ